jgi:hypothetical protein
MKPKRGLIHQRTRPLLRPLMRVPLVRGSGGFSPLQVFAGSAAGMWLDPSDISTGFTDSAGTTPQTASAQQTGMRVDKRIALGSELVTVAADRDFSSDTGFWSKVGTTISGGAANWAASAGGELNKTLVVTFGSYYEVTWTITSISSGGLCVLSGGNTGPTRTTAGTYTERIRNGGSNLGIGWLSIGSTTASIDNVSIKQVTGNHVAQATGAARPEYDVITGISSDFFDATDDGYNTAVFAAGTLVSGMDCFIAIKRSSAVKAVVASHLPSASDKFFAAYDSAGGATTATSAVTTGTPTYKVNGVDLNGGAVGTTRVQLDAALTTGSWFVVEIIGLDLSVWTQFSIGEFTGNLLNADIGGVILCPTQTTANRAALRKWLGAKVGLSL